ncbi:uncharacterized protein LOC119689451 [Teleopsis dalmanni]|uniref:uncharacterized protein LOC119689392 n=1 Tax=Teleopsis dalmanni TaxID=139649 RepID=UPI0018CEF88A|nr:uncharacterized protein LOC119689392 [Teleopsis dalmanni]XP_037960215.1 uncharacterized protein LOC119689451 [Teleopsis dalmanni]
MRLDGKLTFWVQIKYAVEKAAKATAALSKLMANTGGPVAKKRKLLMTTVNAILPYSSEVWADALDIETRRKEIIAVHRRAALRITSAYRTVLAEAVFVIAGVTPIDLQAKERQRVYNRKTNGDYTQQMARQDQDQTIEMWQQRWNNSTQGR